MENTKNQDQDEPMPQMMQGMPSTPRQNHLDSEITRQKEQTARLEELVKLREAARPLIEYLRANHHPHIYAYVDSNGLEILEGQKAVKLD